MKTDPATPSFQIPAIALLCGLTFVCSCASINHRVADPATAPVQGLLYYAPKHVIEVETVTVKPIHIRAETSAKCPEGYVKIVEPGAESVTGAVSMRLTSDTNRVFVISAKSSWLMDNNLTIEVGAGSRISGINSEADGKLDDVVVSLAKFAGAVAGLASKQKSLPAAGDARYLNNLSTNAATEIREALALHVRTILATTNIPSTNLMKWVQATGAVDRAIISSADDELASVLEHIEDSRRVELLQILNATPTCPPPSKAKDEAEKFFLASNPRFTNTTERIKKLQSDLGILEARRMDLLKDGVPQNDGNGTAISAAVEALKFQAEAVRQDMDAARAQYAQAFAAFRAEKGLGDFEQKTVARYVLELDELLSVSNLLNTTIAGTLGSDIAFGKLHSTARTWLEKHGCLVVISAENPMRSPAGARGVAPKNRWARLFADPGEIEGLAYVPAYPARIAVYRPDEHPSGELWMRCVSVQEVELLHPMTRLQELPFSSSLWGERAITIGFNAAGSPVKASWKGTSSAATLSKALADGAVAARDEYANSVAKLRKIQEDQRAIELNSINSEIDQLNKRRELLEAQLSLEATQQTYDAALEIRLLDVEIKLLKNKASIIKEQAALESPDI